MKIALGADHGGYRLKEMLAEYLRSHGHEVVDVGTSSDEAVDYPVFAQAVARRVAEGACERGIMVDGAGIGSAMAANKVSGVRAALAYDLSSAVGSREHNDANVLTLGAGLIGPALARQIVEAWLAAECVEERHKRRVDLMGEIEQGKLLSPAGQAEREISPEDLERIAEQLRALLGDSPAGASPGPSVGTAPDTARRFLDLGAGRLTTGPQPGPVPDDIASHIDHTLLKPDATEDAIRSLCAEAREHRFAAVCVNPVWAPVVSAELRGTPIATCCVVGFPLGATHPEIKALEARRAIREGAAEIDMVINIGALKGGDDARVLSDVRAVVEACRDGSARCKVILETALLTEEEKRRVCQLARRARAHFVKTSTGFGPGGATVADVQLMVAEVHGAGMEVKASGGIRTYPDAQRMIDAGATRIGASAGVAIVAESRAVAVSA